MADNKIFGDTLHHDINLSPPGFGTIGGAHIVPSSISGGNLSNIVRPYDPRIFLTSVPPGGLWTIDPGLSGNQAHPYQGSISNNTVGAAMTIFFNGTAASLYARTGPECGQISITIDGVASMGLTNTSTALAVPAAGENTTPVYLDLNTVGIQLLNSTSTTITTISANGFPTSGTILIDNEQITYSGISGAQFTGCTRGANGTQANEHKIGSPVYLMNSSVEMYVGSRYYRSLVWSNDNLSAGDHKMVITITGKNASSSNYYFIFEALQIGGVLGTGNISTFIDYADIAGFTTNGSGVAPGVTPLSFAADYQLIGILGVWDASNRFSYQWNPNTGQIILFGGAGSTTYATGDVKMTFMKLGKPI